MKSGLCRRPLTPAAAMEAACASWFDGPTTKFANVYFVFMPSIGSAAGLGTCADATARTGAGFTEAGASVRRVRGFGPTGANEAVGLDTGRSSAPAMVQRT